MVTRAADGSTQPLRTAELERVDGSDRKVPAPAVARAVKVVEALAVRPSTLGQLSRDLSVAKSSVYDVVSTLIACGWVDAVSGGYALSQRFFDVSRWLGQRQSLISAFRPAAKSMVERAGETVWLGVLEGDQVVYLDSEEGTHAIRYVTASPNHVPAHATALGKVMLAYESVEQVRSRLSGRLSPVTARTASTLADLENEFAEIRAAGYGLDLGELDADMRCVAAPIRGSDGQVIASISMAGPAFRFEKLFAEYIETICDAAAGMSIQLGFSSENELPPARYRW
jgi:IclR family KDG regulon transcriptional repressor